MSREKLEIRKGGKLVETRWVYDKNLKKGSYVENDVTNKALRFLFEPCEIENGATLKDVFLLLNTELDIFDAVLGNWCKEIVTEGLTGPDKPYKFDEEGIEYLELYWNFHYDNGTRYGPSFYGYNRPSFHGIGWERTKDSYFDWVDKEGNKVIEYKKGARTNWGICLTPSNELINIPVKLDPKATVFDDNLDHESDHKAQTGHGYPLTEYNGAMYTFGNIIEGIIWELSFHGGPTSRTKVGNDLKQMSDDIKAGTIKTVSVDEFFKSLDKEKEEE